MEVKTNNNPPEKENSTSRSSYKNKYVEYRKLYENSRNFQQSLQGAQGQTTAPADFVESQLRHKQENIAAESERLPLARLDEQALTPKSNTPDGGQGNSSGLRIPDIGAAGGNMLEKVKHFEPLILTAAERYQLPPELIAGVIWQESRGNPRAVSHCGAMGLMQLMPATAASLGVSNPFDPAQNIDGGAKYLRQMLDKFGRVEFAVAAYNAGPGNVAKHGGIPPFAETQNYVPKVLGYANSFKVAQAFSQNLPNHAVRV